MRTFTNLLRLDEQIQDNLYSAPIITPKQRKYVIFFEDGHLIVYSKTLAKHPKICQWRKRIRLKNRDYRYNK